MCCRILRALLIPAAVSLLACCALDLVSEPSANIMAGSSGASKAVLRPPTNVSASHGEYRSVKLSWSSADGAAQYYIYSAATPFDTFRQTAETKGTANSISITEDAGTTAYYAISTVDKEGNVSEKSFIVLGSVLSSPIITSITQDSSGTASTVTWWMANCSHGTYMDTVKYEVTCYAEDKTSVVATVNTQGSETSATFRNLTPNTKYYYQVQAFTSTNQSSMESSGLEDADTARRLIPSAPQDLQAATGTSAESVELTWTLPDYVDYKVGSESYEQHPVYFTIERKEKGGDDSEYTKIVSYLGTMADGSGGSESRITFNCAEQTSSSDSVSVTAGDMPAAGGAYGAYIPGSRLTWRDTTAERGRQYVWRVQSYTDDSSTIISSQESVSTAEGWLLAPVSFKASAEYMEKDDGKKYASIDVSFQVDFEDFGQKYSYVLTYTRTEFEKDSSDEERLYHTYDSISKVKAEHHIFDFDEPDLSDDRIAFMEGYYRYTLYIAPAGTTSVPSEYYARADSPNSITVTNEADKLPSINGFKVTDGYADKFILEWDYDQNCEYTISWVNYKDETTQSDDAEPRTKELSKAEIKLEGETARYEHKASPGDCRAYSLIAERGLRTEKSYTDADNNPIVSCTLGKAVLIPGQPDYSTITVQWRSVQRARGEYKVSAVYSGNDEELTQSDNAAGEGYTSITEENGIYTCVINKPKGYDDAKESGKAVIFTVTSTSESQEGVTTTSEAETRTAGPALLETKAAMPVSDSIQITWKAMDFAQGYIIRRIRYTDSSASTPALQSDTYYYDGTALSVNGEPVDDGSAAVYFSGGTYTLTDKYSEQKDENSPYQTNQSMISWGLPYGYAVLPVINGPEDFSFGEGITLTGGSSKVQYGNISDVKNAAYGYGLRVRAHKASSSYEQRIEWELPYYGNNSANLYRRQAGSSANSWKKVTDIPAGKKEISYRPAPGEITEAYEYAVAYRESKDNINLPASLVNGTTADKGLSKEETNYTYPDDSKKERLNKGYLLATNFSAGYGGDSAASSADQYYYSEKVTWSEWDYDKRAIGPTGAYVSIKNYNLSGNWTKVFSLDSSLHYSGNETVPNTDIWKADEVTAYLSPHEVATADSVNSGSMVNTDGPLMVLRDAKHYYSLTLVRESTSVSLAEDDSVYACRQLSDAEIARAAMLALSYGFYVHDGGPTNYTKSTKYNSKYSNKGDVQGKTGSISFTDRARDSSLGLGKFSASYRINGSYAPEQLTPGGALGTCVSISQGSSFSGAFGIKGDSDNYVYKFINADNIIVKTADSSIPDYNATITFACSGTNNIELKISRGGASDSTLCEGKTSTVEIRKRWFPMQLQSTDLFSNNGEPYEITNPEYGWWPK